MTPATPAELNAQYEDAEVPLDLIDDPETAIRETMDEQRLADLALSIREVGLIEKPVLLPNGDRFSVDAGHRRIIACRMINYSPVPCRIKRGEYIDPLSILIHENAFREGVNFVEEAKFFQLILEERCGNDVDQLCQKVRRRREYVEDRLNLLRGDVKVMEALQAKKISLAVAKELNKVEDPGRLRLLLDTAQTQGATARMVMQWRRETAMLGPVGEADATDGQHPHNPQGAPAGFTMECLFCESTEHTYMMEAFFLHKPCKDILLKMLQRLPQPQQERES